MAIKQKTMLLAVSFIFSCSFLVAFAGSSVFAQEASDCNTNPDASDCVNPGTIDEEEVEPPKDRLDCTGDDADSKCCGGVKTSIISGDLCGTNEGDLKNNSVYKLLIGALNILTAAIGVAAVGGIGYGALLYTTAQNSPEQTKRAISIITNVVIGIVAYGLMYVLLNFLIPGGIFG